MSQTPITIRNRHHVIKIYTSLNRQRPLYQVVYYVGPERVRKSYSDLREAKRAATLALAELSGCRVEAEQFSHPDLESFAAARRVLDKHGMSVLQACEQMDRVLSVLGGRASPVKAVEEWVELRGAVTQIPTEELVRSFIESRERQNCNRSYLRSMRCRFAAFLRQFPGRAVSSLRCAEMESWVRTLPGQDYHRRNTRIFLIAFGNWCRKHGHLPDRATEFDRIPSVKIVRKEVEVFTPGELRGILGHCPESCQAAVAIAAFAGLRIQEVERLTWQDVKLDQGHILVSAEKAKTRQRRIVPILSVLRAWLYPVRREDGPVVPGGTLSLRISQACRNAGVARKRNALRHSFVSYRLAVTGDAARTALEAGHDQQILFRHYREAVTGEAGNAWFAVFPEGSGGTGWTAS